MFTERVISLAYPHVSTGVIMVRVAGRVAFAAVALSFLVGSADIAAAQDRRQNEPGQFDFYVLALSWSPSFCEAAGERGRDARSSNAAARPYSFVVHGLWPQYENGFPEFCQRPAPRLNRNIVSSMLDLMPAPRLIFHEWDKHGTCSGLSPQRLFRDHPQGARGGEDPGGLYRARRAAHGDARRGRGGLRQGQSRPDRATASR